MKRVKKLRARTEKYKDRQTGQEKQGYATMGYLLQKEDGTQMVKIDSIPVNFDGWIYFGDLETQQARETMTPAPAPQAAAGYSEVESDDIPFN